MKKEDLNEKQVRLIQKYLRGEFNQFTAKEETRTLFMDIISKAEKLCEELNAYDECGDDLIAWYYEKYKEAK